MIGVAERMVPWWSCHHDGMLTFGYILPRQAPVHNPYYSILLFYACALSFKELNENHLNIFILIQWVLLVCQDHVDCYAIGPGRSQVITCHLWEIGEDIIVTIIILPSHGIYIWTIIGDRAGLYVDLVRQSSKALVAFVLPMSVEDRLLLWMVVRS